MKRFATIIPLLFIVLSCGTGHVAARQDGEKVDIGYGSIDRKNTTTAVSKIKNENDDVMATSNIYEYLASQCSGVGVIRNGNSYQFVIRGTMSFMGNTAPLIVVDGSPVDNVDGLSPYEIESVSVLKDAGAAVYGSQGGNGVILITLKHE